MITPVELTVLRNTYLDRPTIVRLIDAYETHQAWLRGRQLHIHAEADRRGSRDKGSYQRAFAAGMRRALEILEGHVDGDR
jgi:hypothetical protein